MRHRKGFNTLGLKPSHRKSLIRNMVTSLFRYERIKTTKAKALEVRRTAEKMITRAKVDSVHNRRTVAKKIWDKEILNKLFTEIAPGFDKRPGGYTRILKTGYRQGDAADMVILELVQDEVEEKTSAKKKSKAAPKPAKEEKKEAKKEEAAKPAAAEETAKVAEAEDAKPEAEEAAVEEKAVEDSAEAEKETDK